MPFVMWFLLLAWAAGPRPLIVEAREPPAGIAGRPTSPIARQERSTGAPQPL